MTQRTRKYLRYFSPILIGFLLVLSILVLIGRAQDSLASYFPSDAPVYASFQANSQMISNKFYQRWSSSFEYKALIDGMLEELYPGSKNVSFAAYGTAEHPRYIVALHLKENADLAPFEAVLRSYRWDSFVMTRPVSKSKIMLASNDFSYLADIRSNFGVSRSTLIALKNISLHSILSSYEGQLKIRLDELPHLLPSLRQVSDSLQGRQIEQMNFGLKISKKQGNIIASNLQLEPLSVLQMKKPGMINRAFSLGHVDGVLAQILEGIRARYQTQNTILSLLAAYEAQRPQTLSYLDYDNNSMLLEAQWEQEVPSVVFDQIVGTMEDLMADGHRVARTVYLPDGSPITAILKNNDAYKTQIREGGATIHDLVNDEVYELSKKEGRLIMRRGDEDLLESSLVEIDGCMADRDVNFALLDIHKIFQVGENFNIGKLLVLEHNIVSPSLYPQISFCLY